MNVQSSWFIFLILGTVFLVLGISNPQSQAFFVLGIAFLAIGIVFAFRRRSTP